MPDRLLIGFCLFALMGIATYSRNAEWQDPRVLWESASTLAPVHARPKLNLAREAILRQHYFEAELLYWQILTLPMMDRTNLYRSNARNAAAINLGLLLVRRGEFDIGERLLNIAVSEWPNVQVARLSRAQAYLAMNRCKEAVSDLKAIRAEYPTC